MARTWLHWVSSLGCLGLLGAGNMACSGTRAADRTALAASQASAPSFDHLRQRELGRLAQHEVRFPGRNWTASVEADAVPAVSVDSDSTVVDIPIGTQDSIRCHVYADDVDPGASLARVFEAGRKHADSFQITPVAVTVAADAPALQIAASYVTRTSFGMQATGELEVIFHARPAHPVLCLHDELGYTQSFRRIALGFSGSLRTESDPTPKPAWLEILVVKVGKLPVGFKRRAMIPADGGGSLTMETSTYVLPLSSNAWVFGDEGNFFLLDAAGRVQRAAFAQFSGSRELLNLRLEKVPLGGYQVSGKRAGRPVNAEFRTIDPSGLPGPALLARWLTERERVDVEEFHPNLDPSRPLTVTYRRAGGRVTAQLERAQLDGSIDVRGYFRRYELSHGRTRMAFERVLSRGAR